MAVITDKFIFIHVPKTGGSSILGAALSVTPGKKGWQLKHHSGPMHKRMREDRFVQRALKSDPRPFVFGFVRHPYDWILSRYRWQGEGRSIPQWLEEDREKDTYHGRWSWPMSSWLQRVDYIGKLETIEEDWAKISKGLGLPSELPHYNKSPRLGRELICDEAKRLILEVHGEDMERFGYAE